MSLNNSTLLIIGLGNPGTEYYSTPHNVGFAAVDALHTYLEKNSYSPTPWKMDKKSNTLLAQCTVNDHKLIIANPQTFMNLSGSSVQALTTNYQLPTTNCIVLHDDIDLVQGTVRIRNNGSSAGHKGIQNIIEVLGTQEFARVRIGVRPSQEFAGDTTAFVLKKMNKAAQQIFEQVHELIIQELLTILQKGIEEKTLTIEKDSS